MPQISTAAEFARWQFERRMVERLLVALSKRNVRL
jgi:hypothetical protein